jgi:threonine synthase
MSAMTHLECARCGASHDADVLQNVCECGSPLLVRYDLAEVAATLDPVRLRSRGPTLWRYAELLPVRNEKSRISMEEGWTPLLPLHRLGADLDLRLSLKDESPLPGGTFKARGAAVGVSRAVELGIEAIAMPTNGNAGAAWSMYAARADIEALIVMPADAPAVTSIECTLAGARLFFVRGLIGDAGRMVSELVASEQWFDASTLNEPYRIEGKKTIVLEIAEQLSWKLPDVIVCPTGGGVALIGIWKGIGELLDLGWVDRRMPRLVAVQSSGCAPIVAAYESGAVEATPWPEARTVAFGINVPKPLGDFLVLRAIRESGGSAVAVSDADLIAEQARVMRLEGAFVCPEGAAAVAAVRSLRRSGWLSRDERVVVLNTGSGLVYPEAVRVQAPVLDVGESLAAYLDGEERVRR